MNEALLKDLQSLRPNSIVLGLERINRILSKLDNPHKKLNSVIHVAGTNGKGSTIAFLRSIYEQAGYKVNVYTSPHLIDLNERIRLSGKLISDTLLQSYLQKVIDVNNKEPLTFFEALTATAFLAFADNPADLTLIEVGMGGRFDATNVIEKPLLSIITSISYDHQEYLGNTLESIAFEKAGIIKQGVPVITTLEQQPHVLDVLKNQTNQLIVVPSLDPSFKNMLGLKGSYQLANASLALKAVETLQFPVSSQHIEAGLKKVVWPGRFQVLEEGFLRSIVPKNIEVIVDGSHNPQGSYVISQELQDHSTLIISSMLKRKAAQEFYKALIPKSTLFICIPMDETFYFPIELENIIKKLGGKTMVAPTIQEALLLACKNIEKSTRILFTGSLYLVGEVLKQNIRQSK
ncbi:MAG: bifunctional folylpolyglutamate synthase/dihydrofolate synthase [Proteobacteria bacterium]|nr:bifunctional folylpolyglutamate synthase/dihydrofolate synthase [Pseudomonadota bacterium]